MVWGGGGGEEETVHGISRTKAGYSENKWKTRKTLSLVLAPPPTRPWVS